MDQIVRNSLGMDLKFCALRHAGKERFQVKTQGVAEVTALLDDHTWQAEGRNPFSDAPEAIGRYRQSAERIAFERIEAKRHDQHVGRKCLDAAQAGVERLEEPLISGFARQW